MKQHDKSSENEMQMVRDEECKRNMYGEIPNVTATVASKFITLNAIYNNLTISNSQ